MTGRLEGKVALVAGAASGIGRSIATQSLADGALVVLADIDASGIPALAATSDRRALATQCDVKREADVEAESPAS